MAERWLPVPDHPGYEVSDFGNLRSYWERGGPPLAHRDLPVPLNPARTKAGYLVAYLRNTAGVRRLWGIHQIVLLAFVGPPPADAEALHWDDVGSNNVLSNLRYGTRSDNRLDQIRNSGPPLHRAVLTEVDVRAIRVDPRSPFVVAAAYGVCYETIHNIRIKKTWTHLS